jgi:hypothetical protein
MQATKSTKMLFIKEQNGRFLLMAISASDFVTRFSDCETLIGARRMLAFHAKRLGLTKKGLIAE